MDFDYNQKLECVTFLYNFMIEPEERPQQPMALAADLENQINEVFNTAEEEKEDEPNVLTYPRKMPVLLD